MIPETFIPVLLAVAGSILALAGLLIIAARRRRSVTALGAIVALAGLVTVSPGTASQTAGSAVSATSAAITGLTDRTGVELPDPAAGEIVAAETPAAP